MKQTFYLYREVDGVYLFADRDKLAGLMSTGTVELDVQPIKKEVEKVIQVTSLAPINPKAKWVNENVPIDTSDVVRLSNGIKLAYRPELVCQYYFHQLQKYSQYNIQLHFAYCFASFYEYAHSDNQRLFKRYVRHGKENHAWQGACEEYASVPHKVEAVSSESENTEK